MTDSATTATTVRGADESEVEEASLNLRIEVVWSPDTEAVGTSVVLVPETDVVIGRDVALGLRIRDPRLSRVHLRLVWDSVARGFRYGDADSANGTFVNGYRAASGLLLPNDVVRIGATLLVAVERDHAAELSARALAAAASLLSVLVHGETGSGKEVLARAIHDGSGRSGPFVALNCAALSPELAAAELFGHARGAFSGATQGRPGLFRAADGGTLLLDEIGDLPLELQGHLLRTLQESRVRPVGSDQEVCIDVRIMAATHVDLNDAVERGRFRPDLLARLAQIVLEVPPLRERRNELVRLLSDIVPGVVLTPSALEALLIGHFPGNIRELAAVVGAARALSGSPSVRLSDLAPRLPSAARIVAREAVPQAPRSADSAVERRKRLALLLTKHQGNIAGVAREIGKPRAQVYRWLRALGLSRDAR